MSELTTAYTVTKATQSDCLGILNEPALKEMLGVAQRSELISHIIESNRDMYVIALGKYSMLFYYTQVNKAAGDSGIYEVHVACPKGNRIASRALLGCLIDWIFTVQLPTCRAIVTNCPEGKIANSARKAGLTQIANKQGNVYFMLPNYTL